MKKSKNIVLIVTPVLSAALLNACGGSSQPRTFVNPSPAATPVSTPLPLSTVAPQTAQTRDVYSSVNDCIKDWGARELCEQMGDDDDRDYKSRYKSSSTNKYFYGPQYSSSNRIITYKGKTVSPTGKVSKLPTYVSSVPTSKTTSSSSTTTPTSKSTTGTTTSSSSSTSSTLPSTTSKSTTSSTSPSSTTSSTSSSSTYNPYSSSSTTRGGFGTTSSSSSSSSSSSGS